MQPSDMPDTHFNDIFGTRLSIRVTQVWYDMFKIAVYKICRIIGQNQEGNIMEHDYWYEDQKQQHLGGSGYRPAGRKISFAALIISMIITALIGGLAGGYYMHTLSGRIQPESTPQVTQPNSAPAAAVPELPTSIESKISKGDTEGYTKTEIVQLAAPSIVGIGVEGTSIDWYGRNRITSGSGSGVIVSNDGYIITNDHVVAGAEKIKVYLDNDTEYDAALVGTDSRTDLAVIKIEASGLTPVIMGNSDALLVGEDVIAIGNPLGELRGTATSGMVSALSRTITIGNREMTLLQTDAAINPGNSGGGLFNAKAELIGIINAKIASVATEGLGFAIPVNSARRTIKDLIDLGYVSGRAYLGVYTRNVALTQRGGKSGIFDFYGEPENIETRVQVTEVAPNSAAESAGIKAGDLILQLDEATITTGNELAAAIAEYNAGDMAIIKLQRDKEELQVTVKFGELIPN